MIQKDGVLGAAANKQPHQENRLTKTGFYRLPVLGARSLNPGAGRWVPSGGSEAGAALRAPWCRGGVRPSPPPGRFGWRVGRCQEKGAAPSTPALPGSRSGLMAAGAPERAETAEQDRGETPRPATALSFHASCTRLCSSSTSRLGDDCPFSVQPTPGGCAGRAPKPGPRPPEGPRGAGRPCRVPRTCPLLRVRKNPSWPKPLHGRSCRRSWTRPLNGTGRGISLSFPLPRNVWSLRIPHRSVFRPAAQHDMWLQSPPRRVASPRAHFVRTPPSTPDRMGACGKAAGSPALPVLHSAQAGLGGGSSGCGGLVGGTGSLRAGRRWDIVTTSEATHQVSAPCPRSDRLWWQRPLLLCRAERGTKGTQPGGEACCPGLA